jgi:integrase
MKGSVTRHTGRGGGGAQASWSYRIEGGRDPKTGRRLQHRRSGFKTQKAAQQAMADALSEMNRGEYVRPAKGTLGDYMSLWLDQQAAHLRPTTLYAYAKVVNRRIIPGLGSIQLTALDAMTIEQWYGQLLKGGAANGQALNAKTVRNTAGVLSKALSDAVRLRQLRHNPAKDARLPRRDRPDTCAWTADEATTFLQAARHERWYPMWRLVLATGLRRGELLGLRWQDLDLSGGRLEVVETRVIADHEVVGPPKSRAGARIVALDQDTVAALHAWRRQIAADHLAAGPAWQDTGRVFVDEFGNPPHPESVTRWWGEACLRHGVRRIRLHDARHTAATLMLRAGQPVKVVAQRLGHADVAVTMRVYQHVTAQDDQQAADTLGRLLGG